MHFAAIRFVRSNFQNATAGTVVTLQTTCGELLVRLYDACVEADTDPDIRTLILTGAGGNFCSGADLKGWVDGQEKTLVENLGKFSRQYARQVESDFREWQSRYGQSKVNSHQEEAGKK